MEQVRKARVFRSSEDRRAEIVAAAFACLQEVGYAKLTARKIAEHSNISLGHITYHFKSMNEVLVETYRYASSALYEATVDEMRRSSASPVEQLKAFLGTGFTPSFLRRDYLRVRIDLWSAALSSEDVAQVELELYERYRANLSRILELIAAERESDLSQVATVSDYIMATLDGLWLDWERRQSEAAIRNGLNGCLLLAETALRRSTQG